jgi:hypothetical protein
MKYGNLPLSVTKDYYSKGSMISKIVGCFVTGRRKCYARKKEISYAGDDKGIRRELSRNIWT